MVGYGTRHDYAIRLGCGYGFQRGCGITACNGIQHGVYQIVQCILCIHGGAVHRRAQDGL